MCPRARGVGNEVAPSPEANLKRLRCHFLFTPLRQRASMDKQTIDQTESEVHLHRVLYVIKFLRALVLHLLLAVVAALLFFSVGIDGVYPIANDMIHALRAQSIENRLQDGPIGSLGFVIVLSVLLVALFAMLMWIYRSITNVRRSALKFQAALIVLMTISNFYTTWPKL